MMDSLNAQKDFRPAHFKLICIYAWLIFYWRGILSWLELDRQCFLSVGGENNLPKILLTLLSSVFFCFFLTQQYNSGWNPGKSVTGPWWGAGSLRRWSSGKSSFIHTEKLKADIVRGHCLHSVLRDLLGMNTCLIWPWSTWFPSQILQQSNSRPL